MASKHILENQPVPRRVKLSLLWASLMALYIYNDYFVLFVPGYIDSMSEGSLGPFGSYTEFKMVVIALILAIPASMVFLSSTLPIMFSRWLNLILGAIYLVIAGLTLIGSPPFYQMIVGFEIAALVLILWLSSRWPRQAVEI